MSSKLLFTQQQLNEHVELARRSAFSEAAGLLDSYGEALKRQAAAQDLDTPREILREVVDMCVLMAEVVRTRGCT
jgi:hypothetical protein